MKGKSRASKEELSFEMISGKKEINHYSKNPFTTDPVSLDPKFPKDIYIPTDTLLTPNLSETIKIVNLSESEVHKETKTKVDKRRSNELFTELDKIFKNIAHDNPKIPSYGAFTFDDEKFIKEKRDSVNKNEQEELDNEILDKCQEEPKLFGSARARIITKNDKTMILFGEEFMRNSPIPSPVSSIICGGRKSSDNLSDYDNYYTLELHPNYTQFDLQELSTKEIDKMSSLFTEEIIYNFQIIQSLTPLESWEISSIAVALPKAPEKKELKTLVLDMDETLLHTKSPYLDYTKVDISLEDIRKIDIPYVAKEYSVILRPFLQTFIRELAKLYEIIIYTAGSITYATAIKKALDPNKEFISHVLSRMRCIQKGKGIFIKPLELILGPNRCLEDIIIVDNSIISFANHIENGIYIPSFMGDRRDGWLQNLFQFLKENSAVSDIRKSIEEKFLLKRMYKVFVNTINHTLT